MDENPGRAKRVSKACVSCRVRKARCSGTKPCSRCVRDDIVCVYSTKTRRRVALNNPQDHIDLLENQQESLINGVREMYRRMLIAGLWEGPPVPERDGVPQVVGILEGLGIELDGDHFEFDERDSTESTGTAGASTRRSSSGFDFDSLLEQPLDDMFQRQGGVASGQPVSTIGQMGTRPAPTLSQSSADALYVGARVSSNESMPREALPKFVVPVSRRLSSQFAMELQARGLDVPGTRPIAEALGEQPSLGFTGRTQSDPTSGAGAGHVDAGGSYGDVRSFMDFSKR